MLNDVRYMSLCSSRSSQRSTTIEWKLQSNQRRNAFRSRAAGQTDGTRYQPFNCSSKISLLTSARRCSASSSVSHSGKQVYRRLQSQVVQCQMRAGWIHSVQPVQKWLRRLHYQSGSVDRLHGGDSGCSAVVVIQHAAQSFAALDNAGTADMSRVGENQSVAQTLMVAFGVVMGHEVLNCCPQ